MLRMVEMGVVLILISSVNARKASNKVPADLITPEIGSGARSFGWSLERWITLRPHKTSHLDDLISPHDS